MYILNTLPYEEVESRIRIYTIVEKIKKVK